MVSAFARHAFAEKESMVTEVLRIQELLRRAEVKNKVPWRVRVRHFFEENLRK